MFLNCFDWRYYMWKWISDDNLLLLKQRWNALRCTKLTDGWRCKFFNSIVPQGLEGLLEHCWGEIGEIVPFAPSLSLIMSYTIKLCPTLECEGQKIRFVCHATFLLLFVFVKKKKNTERIIIVHMTFLRPRWMQYQTSQTRTLFVARKTLRPPHNFIGANFQK